MHCVESAYHDSACCREPIWHLLVPRRSRDALTRALSCVLDDEALRERLAAGARRVRDRLPTWDDAADGMAALLARLESDGRFAR